MSTGGTKRRRVYDITSKKLIIAYAEEYGNRAAGRFYNIPESCIRLWRKSLAEPTSSQGISTSTEVPLLIPSTELLELSLTVASKPEKRITTKEPNISVVKASLETSTSTSDLSWHVQLDEELRNYVSQLYENGSPVLLDEVMLKTYDIIMSLNISRQDLEISREWIKTFLKYRSSVSCRISKSPRVVKEIETKLYKYHNVVMQLRKQHNYPLNQIGNAHQVNVFLDYPPSNEKCVAVMLCVTADGSKLPPFIVFKSDNILKKTLPRNVIVRTEDNGNMTPKLMTEWYKLVWGCRTGMEYNPRAMLTLDYTVSHLLTEDWLVEGNTDLIVIPKGLNLIPQPLNVHVHTAFKDNLRWECEKWLLSHGRLKSASASLILYWIAGAWKNVSEEIIINSFKNCHLSNDLESLEAAKYTISDNYVVFCEEISIRDVSLGVPSDCNNSSSLLNQQSECTAPESVVLEMPSSIAVKSGIAEEVPVVNTLEDVRKETQDPLAVGALEERSILKKLLNDVKVEPHCEDQEHETNAIKDEVSQQEIAPSLTNTSTLVPPKGQVMLMMHNGNIVMVEDALPSTIENML